MYIYIYIYIYIFIYICLANNSWLYKSEAGRLVTGLPTRDPCCGVEPTASFRLHTHKFLPLTRHGGFLYIYI